MVALLPAPLNLPLLSAVRPLFHGIWAILAGSYVVLFHGPQEGYHLMTSVPMHLQTIIRSIWECAAQGVSSQPCFHPRRSNVLNSWGSGSTNHTSGSFKTRNLECWVPKGVSKPRRRYKVQASTKRMHEVLLCYTHSCFCDLVPSYLGIGTLRVLEGTLCPSLAWPYYP